MAIIDVLDQDGNKLKDLTINDDVFNRDVHEPSLYLAVREYMHNNRQWTRATKTRGEVSGGGKKPWKQKGTGRARSGSIRSPLWKGGAVVLGPQMIHSEFKVNKKVNKLAMRSALSSRYKGNAMVVVDGFRMDQVKTKQVKEIFKRLNINNALVVLDSNNKNFQLSARNVSKIKVIKNDLINVYDIMKHKQLVVTEKAAVMLGEALSK
ncbi:MAG: 50S ribosomal protein L4 [Deltaproteobacteria bacterium]|nr:50S ribosomal protein L4 [Deltaproteobacteria bacterium]MCL5791694.1 50S ribosomal protein L4 [Deltaproteobacteria bacterium]